MIQLARGSLEKLASSPFPLRWALPIAWAAGLWYLSARPVRGGQRSELAAFVWNGGHVVAYFVLATLLFVALTRSVRFVGTRALLAVALAGGYGIIDEWHQSTVPGRDCSTWDVVSDVLGSILAIVCVLYVQGLGEQRWIWCLVPLCLTSVAIATWA